MAHYKTYEDLLRDPAIELANLYVSPRAVAEVTTDEENVSLLSIALTSYMLTGNDDLILAAPICKDGVVDRTDVGEIAKDVSQAAVPPQVKHDDYISDNMVDAWKRNHKINAVGLVPSDAVPFLDTINLAETDYDRSAGHAVDEEAEVFSTFVLLLYLYL